MAPAAYPDLYYDPAYASLYEAMEGGIPECFRLNTEDGEVVNTVMLRPIPTQVNGQTWYDIVTPYGYGGPVITQLTGDRQRLCRAYKQAFEEWCDQRRVVAEFIRFHTLLNNALDWKEAYTVLYSRHTIAIDLTDADYAMNQFTPKCRNTIRKAEKLGVTLRTDEACSDMAAFRRLYEQTMDKNHAQAYYYFPEEYFQQMTERLPGQVLLISAWLGEEMIAGALFLMSDRFMHYHLSATNPAYYTYAANNLILAQAAAYGHARGLERLHLGGGLSGNPEDALYRFKHQFGRTPQNLCDFYVGKRIYNAQVYQKLCEFAGISPDNPYFPAYRAGH